MRLFRWKALVALCHLALQSRSAFNRVDDAGELCEQAIAHQLENSPVVLGDLGLEELLAVQSQAVKVSASFSSIVGCSQLHR